MSNSSLISAYQHSPATTVSDTTSQIDQLLHVQTNSVSLFYGSLPEAQETVPSLQLSIPMDTDGSNVTTDGTRTKVPEPGLGQNGTSQMSLVERLQHLEEVFLYGKEGTNDHNFRCLTLTLTNLDLVLHYFALNCDPK